jgi:hypothetical protein
VEEAILKARDIKALLQQEIAAARQSSHGPWPSVKKANIEASLQFKPVLEATRQLAQELAGNEQITVTTRDNEVELAIGQERRVRASRYGWHRDFAVADSICWSELGQSFERTYSFRSADEVIIFIIKACADLLARQP